MNYYIYEITNLINGKTYVGQRSCHTEIDNDKYMGSGTAIVAAENKYGKNNFSKTILEECSKENLNEREIYWINKRKSENKAEYNISGGGQGCSNPFKYKSKEELDIIKEKMSNSRKGKLNPSGMAGKRFKTFTEGEHNVIEQPCKRSISIKCIETNQIFNSIRECCDILKINHTVLEKYLKGERKYPIGGYNFISLGHIFNPYIIIMETEKTFESIVDCANFLECDKTTIIRVLNGKFNTCHGYHICYYKDYDKKDNIYLNKEPKKNSNNTLRNNSKKVKAINIETKEERVFNCIGDCCRELNVIRSNVSDICNGKHNRKVSKGYTFSFI